MVDDLVQQDCSWKTDVIGFAHFIPNNSKRFGHQIILALIEEVQAHQAPQEAWKKPDMWFWDINGKMTANFLYSMPAAFLESLQLFVIVAYEKKDSL